MTSFHVLASVGTALSLLLSVALAITGWVISGQRARLAEMTTAITAVQTDLANVKLTMASEYVKDHDLQAALLRLDKTLEKMSSSLDTTNTKLEGLALMFAEIRGANSAAKGG